HQNGRRHITFCAVLCWSTALRGREITVSDNHAIAIASRDAGAANILNPDVLNPTIVAVHQADRVLNAVCIDSHILDTGILDVTLAPEKHLRAKPSRVGVSHSVPNRYLRFAIDADDLRHLRSCSSKRTIES